MTKKQTEAEKAQELNALMGGDAAEAELSEAEKAQELGASQLESIWSPMGTAPLDGRPVVLKVIEEDKYETGVDHGVEAVWRVTRAYDRAKGVWSQTGFWALRNGGGQRVLFEPLGWRPVQ